MIGNAPHNRDDLLVTGALPATETFAAQESSGDTEQIEFAGTDAAPVFVDATGWRARIGRRLGLLAGALIVVFLSALGLGMTTGTDVPLTPWSEPTPHPRVKVSRPSVPPSKTGQPPAVAKPQPTRRVAAPVPSATPKPSVTPKASPPSVASTDRPGKSQADPPAWGRKKKNH
ncbi:hypothetical protein E1293_23110 [Actinomadura darangshiensis]|uniref:Uncharacterized protein n=1 Tax=Actinomadura darangshiensis TaxID=705336 RepID=A0A4R5B403_9ACTN|nr:hypothetical protein [Actinomadura darangshiensis]TDD79489.1 hypothetical protein E1293_23110 [Actinomadura darangshiensis]